MSIKTATIWIEGISPLLQARFGEDAEAAVCETKRKRISKNDPPSVQAERLAYRDADGNLYLPGAAIKSLIANAGSNYKVKGSRKSMRYVVPGAVQVTEDRLPVFLKDRKTRADKYEIDARRIVNPSTKGAAMAYRPMLHEWTVRFELQIDDALLDDSTVRQLLEDGGRSIGVGAYRPEKMGPFGRFSVVYWECE